MTARPEDRVSVEVIQRMLKDFGGTNHEAARRLGWFRGAHPSGLLKPDSHRVLKTAGLRRDGAPLSSPQYRKFREHVHYDMAVQFATALGFDPVDYDL